MPWAASETRPVLIGREGNILRLYWMPLLLWMDGCCAAFFIEQLNRKGCASV